MSRLRSRRDFITTAGCWSAGVAFAGTAVQRLSGAVHTNAANTIDLVSAAKVQKFVASLDGRAIRPGDGDYDSARQVWNASFDKHPGVIVVCSGSSDVARAIEFARKYNLLLAVRAGGHSLAGKSSCDGGLVVDLTRMKNICIDSGRRIARAEAGMTLGEFDEATQAHGLATTSGTEPSTGIAGLTLGGGLGWLMGKYGLACDNVRSVDLVLADGRMVTASSTENEDLFWAARGAGANFGVVTALEYDLHPVSTILGGVIKYPADSLRELLKHYRECTPTLPDEVGLSMGTIPGPGGKPILSLAVSYCGDLSEGEKVLRPLRSLRPVLSDDIKPMPYLAFQKLGGLPPGLRLHAFTRSSFVAELSDASIDVIVANAAMTPSFSGNFVLEYIHGKVARTAVTATAFPHRMEGHNFSVHADWVGVSDTTNAREWALSFWNGMQPYLRSAVYSNYLGDESPMRVRAAYGSNYERLTLLKRQFDPSNLFHLNQNILPAPNLTRSERNAT